MLKKTCPNGHVYDQSIYGEVCPLCPPSANNGGGNIKDETRFEPSIGSGAHTRVVQNPDVTMAGNRNFRPQQDPTGETRVSPSVKQQVQETVQMQAQSRKTVIRRNPAMMGGGVKPDVEERKLVGFLVTYNRTPMGNAFNVYEGRNVIGRDTSCDISIPDDNQMSGKHMSIRYLSGNNKFRFHDEMSSNGTYVNKELLDDGELQNYDIIRVGSTLFIFIAIPQI